MRNRLIAVAVAIAALCFGLTGCELIPKDLIGTWTMTEGSNTITMTFEPRTISLRQTDEPGTLSFSVEATDSDARHIDTAVTEAAGAFSSMTIGTSYYWYYELRPDGLYFMFATIAYPPAVQSGPFTKVL
jgi:hypothetical protein